VVVLPVERKQLDDRWKDALAASSLQAAPRVYWGQDGLVEFEFGQRRLPDLPWVALDVVESPLLIGMDPTPPQEIWLWLRQPEYVQLPLGPPGS
jgi:hypothetical protein